jgi:hypothetical protein
LALQLIAVSQLFEFFCCFKLFFLLYFLIVLMYKYQK